MRVRHKLHLGVDVMSVPTMFDDFCWLCFCQVASQVAALDLGYKSGVDKMAEKPKLLFLLGAVSFLIMGIHKGQLSIDFPPEQNTRGIHYLHVNSSLMGYRIKSYLGIDF